VLATVIGWAANGFNEFADAHPFFIAFILAISAISTLVSALQKIYLKLLDVERVACRS
jgi:hypothetical protein